MKQQNREHMSFFKWLHNYWYYYKVYTILALLAVVVVVCVVYIFQYAEADMRCYVVGDGAVDQESFQTVYNRLSEYVTDVDGDDGEILSLNMIDLSGETQSEKEAQEALQKAADSTDTIFFIVDEAGYEALQELCTLRELSYFTIVSDDELRLRLNDGALLQDSGMDAERDWYLVMKYYDEADYSDYYLSIKTDLVVTMALNNDQSEENNVAIDE